MRQAFAAIFVAPSAEQQLRTFVKPIRMLLVKRLHALRISPRPAGVTKLEGEDHLYRIHEGSYRIVYAIREKGLLVLTIKNGTRTEVPRSQGECSCRMLKKAVQQGRSR